MEGVRDVVEGYEEGKLPFITFPRWSEPFKAADEIEESRDLLDETEKRSRGDEDSPGSTFSVSLFSLFTARST